MTKFFLAPDQIERAWTTLKVEVVYAPKTGSIKPWELYGVFSFPYAHRSHWGSFKSEAAANKKCEALRVWHTKKYGAGK